MVIDNNLPVIVNLFGSNLNHFSVVVGKEIDGHGKTIKFILLDPGYPNPIMLSWNAIIELNAQKGPFPHIYWPANRLYSIFGDTIVKSKIRIKGGLAVSSEPFLS
ncbi:MAG: hypothetical protein HQM03_10210 [Magnetococcales bacterium]|nr:hypothetical protein [Magnetococcales bacterium]